METYIIAALLGSIAYLTFSRIMAARAITRLEDKIAGLTAYRESTTASRKSNDLTPNALGVGEIVDGVSGDEIDIVLLDGAPVPLATAYNIAEGWVEAHEAYGEQGEFKIVRRHGQVRVFLDARAALVDVIAEATAAKSALAKFEAFIAGAVKEVEIEIESRQRNGEEPIFAIGLKKPMLIEGSTLPKEVK